MLAAFSPGEGLGLRFARLKLEKPADGSARYAQRDDPASGIDLRDRVRGDEVAVTREASGADGERVGNVGHRPVHRALDPAEDLAATVGDDEAGRRGQIDRERTHGRNLFTI